MELHFLVHEDENSSGFTASAIGHCIVTQAETEAELKGAIRDAVQCHFDKGTEPTIVRLHYSKEETLAII